MATRPKWYGRDAGLTLRMGFTMFLLAAIYLAFLAFSGTHDKQPADRRTCRRWHGALPIFRL